VISQPTMAAPCPTRLPTSRVAVCAGLADPFAAGRVAGAHSAPMTVVGPGQCSVVASAVGGSQASTAPAGCSEAKPPPSQRPEHPGDLRDGAGGNPNEQAARTGRHASSTSSRWPVPAGPGAKRGGGMVGIPAVASAHFAPLIVGYVRFGAGVTAATRSSAVPPVEKVRSSRLSESVAYPDAPADARPYGLTCPSPKRGGGGHR
jgi:hypothetical protein